MREKNKRTKDAAPGPLSRWDSPGIAMIGDDVIWDGEAEYLGLEPLKTISVADNLRDIGSGL